jgi:hypothetical protein
MRGSFAKGPNHRLRTSPLSKTRVKCAWIRPRPRAASRRSGRQSAALQNLFHRDTRGWAWRAPLRRRRAGDTQSIVRSRWTVLSRSDAVDIHAQEPVRIAPEVGKLQTPRKLEVPRRQGRKSEAFRVRIRGRPERSPPFAHRVASRTVRPSSLLRRLTFHFLGVWSFSLSSSGTIHHPCHPCPDSN